MNNRIIFITSFDFGLLEDLLCVCSKFNNGNRPDLSELEAELCRARIVKSKEIPPDVVTMNSCVKLRDLDTNEEMEFTLSFPGNSNIDENGISVIAPIGTAILGYSVGDTIDWYVPDGKRRISIDTVSAGGSR